MANSSVLQQTHTRVYKANYLVREHQCA